MLNNVQRWIVFVMFCAFALACVGLESYLVYALVEKNFSKLNAALALANAGVLFPVGRLFIQLVSQLFLKPSIAPDRLRQYASERCNILQNAIQTDQDEYVKHQLLVVNTLRFAEECLCGWVSGTHFELCVFVDRDQPLLFAYYDSNHHTNARSMIDRQGNPNYYVERGYEVTNLLRNPTSVPRVLPDTLKSKPDYVFVSNQQRTQLRSSILLCLNVATPCALVVSSNRRRAFRENNSELISFLRYVGALVLSDLSDGNLVNQIRQYKPELFQAAPAANN